MNGTFRNTLLASSFLGVAVLATLGANARDRWHDARDGIGTSQETGGYCDFAGCPDHFWRYPIHYGPVFYHGDWYRGPVYFRGDRWARQYWVRGGWHRDEWRGPRPGWAQASNDGPPMPFEFYAGHGFRLGDHWRREHDADNNWDRNRQGPDNGPDNGYGRDDHRGDGDWHRGADNGPPNGGPPNNGQNGGPNNGPNNGHDGNNGGRDQRAGNGGPPGNLIHVTSATYGMSCHMPQGNVTKYLAQSCDGKGVCTYTLQYQAMGGDPAPGCAKDFAVQWTCSMGQGGSASARAEAGLGSKVTLKCESH